METQFAIATESTWSESAGVETLRRMVSVDKYNRWIFQRFESYVGKRILEVGCGIGNMTPFFLDRAEAMTCLDVYPESVAVMTAEFGSDPRIRAVVSDIADPGSVNLIGSAQYDTVVCLNVLEHIEQDSIALSNMHEALAPAGNLLLFVPAGQYLYGRIDKAVGHFRRYSASRLRTLLESQGFEIVELLNMNVAGIPGWYLSGKILRQQVPPRGLLEAFNWLTPAFILAERLMKPRFGLSLACVARRYV